MKYSPELVSNYINNKELFSETDTKLFEALEEIGVRSKKVMDMGCGSGLHMRRIREMGADHGSCVDINESMIETARKNNPEDTKIDFIVADGKNMPVEDESQDVVFSNFVLHYFDNYDDVFSELNRVLKKDGKILVTTNVSEVEDGYDHLYNTTMPIRLGGKSSDVVVQNLIKSEEEFNTAIKNNGLRIVKSEELDHPGAVIDLSYENYGQVKKRVVMFILEKIPEEV